MDHPAGLLIRARFALIYYGARSQAHCRGGCTRDGSPRTGTAEDIGIPAVDRSDKINTAIKRNVIKM